MTGKSIATAVLLGMTAAPALAAPPIRTIATFRQTSPAKGATPKTAYYRNEDVLKTTSVTTKTPVYTTVAVPILKKGVIIGYNYVQKITSYNSVTVKSTKITPKAELSTTNGTSATLAATAVKFTYLYPVTQHFNGSLHGEIAALMTLHAVSTSAAVTGFGYFAQAFETGTLSFKAVTPLRHVAGGHAFGPALTNLLTVNFTGATLFGQIGSTAASFGASTLGGSTLSFTSDFIAFTAGNTPSQFDFSLAQTAALPALTLAAVDPALTNVTGARGLNSFRSNVVGNFSSNAVPEPAGWALLIGGFGLIGLARRRRPYRISVLQH